VDSLTNVVALTDASGSPVSVMTGGSLDSSYATTNSGGQVAYGVTDALGSTVITTSESGAVSTPLYYEPYGLTTGNVSPSFPFAYTGRVPILGNIYYNRARYYDAGTGRFLSEDPFGLAGGTNAYSYAANDPAEFTDPSGNMPLLVLVPIIGGVINGGIEGYANYQCSHDLGKAAKAAAVGFVGGVVGTVAGFITKNPVAAGAIAGFAGNLTEQLLSGKPISLSQLAWNTGFGVVGGKIGAWGFPSGPGRPASLLLNRAWDNYGPKSLEVVGQGSLGGVISSKLGSIYSGITEPCGCSQ